MGRYSAAGSGRPMTPATGNFCSSDGYQDMLTKSMGARKGPCDEHAGEARAADAEVAADDCSQVQALKHRVHALETRNRVLNRKLKKLAVLGAHQRKQQLKLAAPTCADRTHDEQEQPQPQQEQQQQQEQELVHAVCQSPPRTPGPTCEQDMLVLCRTTTSSSSQEACSLRRTCSSSSSSSSSEQECSLSRASSSSSSSHFPPGLQTDDWQQQHQQQHEEDASYCLQQQLQQLQHQVMVQAAALQASAARESAYQCSIASLQHELGRLQRLHQLLQSDYSDLEAGLNETERQRRDYAARYSFVVLDTDGDGFISMAQAASYELFRCYSPELLQAAFSRWRWSSGFPGFLNMDDFLRFVGSCEDRSSRAAQRFWFSVLDRDGDGRLGWADCREAYNAVDKSAAAYVVGFEDLLAQLQDMLGADPVTGFTAGELFRSQLGPGVLGLLTNHNNMLLQRSTAEWNRGDFPL